MCAGVPVNTKGLEADLPDHLRSVLAVAERAKNQVLAPAIDRQSWLLQAAAGVSGGVSSAQGSHDHSHVPATSVLAGLAGSMFRHAFGADPLHHAMAHARHNMNRMSATGTGPQQQQQPALRHPSPPKRDAGAPLNRRSAPLTAAAAAATAAAGGASVPASSSSSGLLPPSVQRSDIRAAAVMAANMGGLGSSQGRKTFADWKAIERGQQHAGARGVGGARVSIGHGSGSLEAGGIRSPQVDGQQAQSRLHANDTAPAPSMDAPLLP